MSRLSKNRHHARKWIRQNHPEVLSSTLGNGIKSDEEVICRELAGLMDNVKLADYKFLQGLARIYFDEMRRNPHEMVRMGNKLNGILKIISVEPHLSEYDRNLNGLSFKELDIRFSESVKKNLSDDKEKISKGSYSRNNDYDIIRINDFEDATKYGNYTSWCVTQPSGKNNYNTYTHNNLGVFYFCLKKGFENVPKQRSEDCPLDEYGLSMIAILVGDDGSLWHCTCRWNHDNGGNDSIMNTEQISELLGVNFYEVLKHRSIEELMSNYENMRVEDDEYCIRNGCIKIEDINRFYYVRVVDGEIRKIPIVGDGLYYDDNVGFIKLTDGPYTIYDCAFYRHTSLQSITIPYGVTSIGKYAFIGCTSLQNVTIPDSVTSIEYGAFESCASLQNLTITDGVTRIGKYAFSYCTSLQNITIPDGVTWIGNGAFRGCESLQSITIPDSVMSIESETFSSCTSLRSINIPDGVTSIGYGAFCNCTSLQSITIPDGVTRIGDCAFSYCTSLKSITIPEGVTSIGFEAFYNCTSLQSITIPDSVKIIEDYVFCGCTSLQSITIPDSVTNIGGGAFSGCKSLRTINVPQWIRDEILSQIRQ